MGQLQSLVFLLDILSVLSLSFGVPLVKSNGDLDGLVVEQHILQLEQTVSSLQREMKLQEQKQAAVLSSVLSKLTSTTDELTNLKSDFNDLENNYTSSLQELSSVKHQLSAHLNEFSKMNNKCQELRQDYDVIKVELAAVKRDQNTTETIVMDNTDMLEKLQENVTSVSKTEFTHSGQNDLRKRVATLERDMKDALVKTDNLAANISHLLKGVAFQAATLPANNIVKDNQVIQFPVVSYNSGGGYVNTSETFIAPVSGTYIFLANIMVADTSAIWVSMHKGMETIGKGYASPGKLNSVAFIFAMTYLDQGNQVCLTNRKGEAAIYGSYSYFGGALLVPH